MVLCRFLAEGVYDLKARLRTKGSDLLVRFGKTEDVALNIVNALRANGDVVAGVYMQKEVSLLMPFPVCFVAAY